MTNGKGNGKGKKKLHHVRLVLCVSHRLRVAEQQHVAHDFHDLHVASLVAAWNCHLAKISKPICMKRKKNAPKKGKGGKPYSLYEGQDVHVIWSTSKVTSMQSISLSSICIMYQTYHTTLHRIVNSNRTQRTFPNKWPSSALKSEIRALSEPMICPNEPRIYFWHVLMFWSDTQIPLHVKVPYCHGGDLDSWSNGFPPRFCQRAMSKAQLIQAGLLEKPKMWHLTSHPYRAMPSTPSTPPTPQNGPSSQGNDV